MNLSTIIIALVLVLLIPAMLLSAIIALLGLVNKAAGKSSPLDQRPLSPETVRAAKETVERFKKAGKQRSSDPTSSSN